MYRRFMSAYEQLLLDIFGFKVIVHLEEVILLIAGIFIGLFLMCLVASNFIFRLEKLERLGQSKIRILRVTKNGKATYQCNFTSLSETFQQLFIMLFSPLFTKKKYTLRDEKRTKRFVRIIYIAAILFFIFAILSICTEFVPQ